MLPGTEASLGLQLFQHDTSVPSVPVPTHEPSSFGGSDLGGGHSPTSAHHLPLNTLDEPVWETILRDVKRIYGNLKLVVFPFGTRDQQTTALRNWDLWGPMVSSLLPSQFLASIHSGPEADRILCLQTFALVLSICLAVGTDEHQQTVFSVRISAAHVVTQSLNSVTHCDALLLAVAVCKT